MNGTTCQIDTDSCSYIKILIISVKRLVNVQKEERRRYHTMNEIRLKKLFINTLQTEFQSRGCVQITMYALKSSFVVEMDIQLIVAKPEI